MGVAYYKNTVPPSTGHMGSLNGLMSVKIIWELLDQQYFTTFFMGVWVLQEIIHFKCLWNDKTSEKTMSTQQNVIHSTFWKYFIQHCGIIWTGCSAADIASLGQNIFCHHKFKKKKILFR